MKYGAPSNSLLTSSLSISVYNFSSMHEILYFSLKMHALVSVKMSSKVQIWFYTTKIVYFSLLSFIVISVFLYYAYQLIDR